jgi:hypothetical protein
MMELYNIQDPQQIDMANLYTMPGQDMMEDTDNLQLNMLNEVADDDMEELFWKKMKKIGRKVSRGIRTASRVGNAARRFVPSKYRSKYDKGLGYVNTASSATRRFRLENLDEDLDQLEELGEALNEQIPDVEELDNEDWEELNEDDLTNEDMMELLDAADYDMSALNEVSPEMQDLFFKKIRRGLKKFGRGAKKGFKKVGKVAKKGWKIGGKVLGGAAKVGKFIKPFAPMIPVVGPKVSMALKGIEAANRARNAINKVARRI